MFVRTRARRLVSVDRAGKVVVDAEFEAAQDLRAIFGIGDEQDRQIARALVRTRLTAQPQTVEGAKAETHDHEVDCLVARRHQRLAWLVSENHVVMRAQRADNALR